MAIPVRPNESLGGFTLNLSGVHWEYLNGDPIRIMERMQPGCLDLAGNARTLPA